MKIKICVAYEIEAESNHPVLEEIANFHANNPFDALEPSKYDEAEKEVKKLTGLSTYDKANSGKKHFYGVYRADDDAPILEY